MKAENVKILSSIGELAKFVDIAIKETVKSIYAWMESNEDEMNECIKRVTQAESDANKIKLKLMKRIAEAQSSLNRTDFLRLVLKMDLIPDYIEGAAVRISKVKLSPDDTLIEEMKPLTEAIVKMSNAFKKTIKNIIHNPAKTEKLCNEIDKIEEEIDHVYRNLEAYLFQSDLDVKVMLQLRNVLYHIEETGDLCHENADHIRIILATI
ncbi:MAG: DUF47 family protein [Candidatus Lokiarchaeota archaeon]|nr:DUF47 family protein [Candidatus Lokiarchaeota archaeon]